MTSKTIARLVQLFSKFPGIGSRSAKRIVLHLIKNRDGLMPSLARSLTEASHALRECKLCKNIDEAEICSICLDNRRDKKILCVVESLVDLWAIEEANFFKGIYHILGGTMSFPNDRDSLALTLASLIERIENQAIAEVIIATNATLEGQTTAFLITERLRPYSAIRVTRFAHGIPIGGELKYLDEVTLSTAFGARQTF
jgi:recombination protein RecR